ncbi:ABC transporter permease [Hydrogenophaga palleronii]|uniref:ABC transporter permease n=1 Tax=Hydrogenophaga palleronii TaxID=65655 RepID=UPI000AE0C8DC|nr:ABC transporter permease [Hydrogenophaga palleronii]
MADTLALNGTRLRVPPGAWLPLALAAVWLLLVDTGLVNHPLMVPLHQVLMAPFFDEQGRQIWAAGASSLWRVALGFAIGASLGIAAGVAVGLSRPAQLAVAPSLHGLRQVALFAWIPLLTAWFGNGDAVKIVFISISTFFPVFLNTEQGVRAIPPVYREVAAVVRLRPWQRLRRLVLPAILPSVLTGVELALLTAWIGTVGSEYAIGTGLGIGAYLATARDVFRMDLVLIGVLVMALVGYGLSRFAQVLFVRLVPWRNR